jgi:hypothetical protein
MICCWDEFEHRCVWMDLIGLQIWTDMCEFEEKYLYMSGWTDTCEFEENIHIYMSRSDIHF